LLAINPLMLGLAGHATHFVMLPALAGIWMLMVPLKKMGLWRCAVAGILFGVACIMKQHGAVFGVFAATWLAWRGFVEDDAQSPEEGGGTPPDLRGVALRLLSLMAGGMFSLLAMAALLAATGTWEKFWHWTVEYGWAYLGIVTFSQGLENLIIQSERIGAAAPGLWLLAAFGMLLLWCEPTLRRWRFFLIMFALFSFVGVCPGFYFREHYFLLLLPAAGLLCGAAWCAAASSAGRLLCFVARASGARDAAMRAWVDRPGFARAAKGIVGGLFVLGALHSLIVSGDVYFRLTPEQACYRIYPDTPFAESLEVARYIEAHCPPNSRIAVMGSEPQIYFYSHRRAATGYIYTYPLMERQPFASQMQRDMVREVESAAPEYLVLVWVPNSWLEYTESDRTIFNWIDHYTGEQMQLDGLVELFPDNHSESHWDLAGGNIRFQSAYWLAIFKRKQAAP
jgi:hypothetical protein